MPCHKTATMGKHYNPKDKKKKLSKKQRKALTGGRQLLKIIRKGRKVSKPQEPILIKGGRQMAKRTGHAKAAPAKKYHRKKKHHVLSGEAFGRLHGNPAEIQNFGIDALTLLVGAVAASFVANMAPVKNQKIKAAIPIGIGAAAMFSPLAKNRLVQAAALGSVAVGLFSLLRSISPKIPLLAGQDNAETVAAAIDSLPAEERAILGLEDKTERYQQPAGEEETAGSFERMAEEETAGNMEAPTAYGRDEDEAAAGEEETAGSFEKMQGGKTEESYISAASIM